MGMTFEDLVVPWQHGEASFVLSLTLIATAVGEGVRFRSHRVLIKTTYDSSSTEDQTEGVTEHNWNNAEGEEIRNVNSVGGLKEIKVKHLFFKADDSGRDKNECLFRFISVGGVVYSAAFPAGGCSLLESSRPELLEQKNRPETFAPCSKRVVNIRICTKRMLNA
ncbi:hypothetical protein CEXT_543451 [Caerostris extrusa]|uniref:Uncharacterized protein n=1 Tax=Caerostris extrusa TaxID=172846 RepID=A0AAV4VPC8_CAEEX|nr:hypothetical protein CEXT_543451 [Caerostris extrusa]